MVNFAVTNSASTWIFPSKQYNAGLLFFFGEYVISTFCVPWSSILYLAFFIQLKSPDLSKREKMVWNQKIAEFPKCELLPGIS